MSIREKELLEKVEEWQNKARCETDPFNKYISMFIAYNIFYNLYAKRKNPDADFTRGDRTRATATINLIEADQLYCLIKSDLKEYLLIIPVFREEYWLTRNPPNKSPNFEDT